MINKKVCFITGITSEIGTSIAKIMANAGCDLVLHYHTKEEDAHRIKDFLEKNYGVSTLLVKADLSNEEEIEKMVDECYKKFSRVDYLINNAALCIDSLYEDKTKVNFMKTLEVNLVGTFLLSRLVGNKMYTDKNGKIIILSSTNGMEKYFPMSLDYDASKAGLISLMHNLSFQYSPFVTVNAIAPGWVKCEKEIKDLDDEYIKSEEEKIFLQRFAEVEEIANVVEFLCSDKASYINNTVIRVDGGSIHG